MIIMQSRTHFNYGTLSFRISAASSSSLWLPRVFLPTIWTRGRVFWPSWSTELLPSCKYFTGVLQNPRSSNNAEKKMFLNRFIYRFFFIVIVILSPNTI